MIAVATTTTAFNGVATTTTARTDVVATIGEKYGKSVLTVLQLRIHLTNYSHRFLAGTIATAFSGSAASGGAASGGAAINAQMDVSVASLAGLFIAVLAF